MRILDGQVDPEQPDQLRHPERQALGVVRPAIGADLTGDAGHQLGRGVMLAAKLVGGGHGFSSETLPPPSSRRAFPPPCTFIRSGVDRRRLASRAFPC